MLPGADMLELPRDRRKCDSPLRARRRRVLPRCARRHRDVNRIQNAIDAEAEELIHQGRVLGVEADQHADAAELRHLEEQRCVAGELLQAVHPALPVRSGAVTVRVEHHARGGELRG